MELIDNNIEWAIAERRHGECGRRRSGGAVHGNLELLIWVEITDYPADHEQHNQHVNYSATFSISDVRMHRLPQYHYGFDNVNDGFIRWDYDYDLAKDTIQGWEFEELWQQIKRRCVTTANRMIACIEELPPIDVERFVLARPTDDAGER